MRLVKRQEFMELPAGTLFSPLLQPWVFGDLSVKGVDMGNDVGDFLELGLNWIDGDDTRQVCDNEMFADSSVSYPLQSAYGREGLFDPEMVYLVYEPADIAVLAVVAVEAGAVREIEGRCENCDRVWMTTAESPCDCPPEEGAAAIRCLDRALLGHHTDSDVNVDEVAARSCPHGTEYDQLCKGCGHKVGSWGVGAAGFLELCDCVAKA